VVETRTGIPDVTIVGEPEGAPTKPTGAKCQNCGAALFGPHCHACGQPVKGLVRHFSSVIGDFLDTVFEYDGRLWRTLGPLMVRPGHLSQEYFAGRRVRYVSPFRLFFFITVIAFFAAQLRFDLDGALNLGASENSIAAASSVEEVEEWRDAAIALLEERIAAQVTDEVGTQVGLSVGRATIESQAARRIAELEAGVVGTSSNVVTGDLGFDYRGAPWDPVTNPIAFGGLPDAMNARLNRWMARANVNQQRIREDPNLLKEAFLSSVPTTLFVLVPIFALLLKLAYVFRRRLYMEHLIVALHTHAFLSATLLLVLLAGAVAGWTTQWPAVSRPLVWLEVLAVIWIPIYILLTQKKIYGQGWPATLVKFYALGACYGIMLAFGLVFSLVFSLVSV
jgi:hypothetical protein